MKINELYAKGTSEWSTGTRSFPCYSATKEVVGNYYQRHLLSEPKSEGDTPEPCVGHLTGLSKSTLVSAQEKWHIL